MAGKAASNLLGPISPEMGMPRKPKCLISTHIVRKKLHFRIPGGHYLLVFVQKVRPLDCIELKCEPVRLCWRHLRNVFTKTPKPPNFAASATVI
jgi:hypothetical protein